MVTPTRSRVAVKAEGGSVPARRRRDEANSDSDDHDQTQQSPSSKRRRSQTLEQTQLTQTQNEGPNGTQSRIINLERDDTGYVTGSIVRVRAERFVTYDAVEFHPGPALNMVLGPNGTGKSTIACAIALGLGFSPKVLGRSSKLSEFVKLGHDSGWVEIELKGKPNAKNYVIRRHFASDSEKTTFTLDGRDATAAKIHETMAKLNVQVGNLCTFLPQDRVSSFSQMPPNELLKETQRAAGNPRLIEWHEWLIQTHKTQKMMKVDLDHTVRTLQQKEEKQQQQEKEVKQFEQRRQFERRLQILSFLAPYAEYTLVRDEWKQSREVRNQVQQDLIQLELDNEPFRNSQQALKRMVHDFESQKKGASTKLDKTRKEIATQVREIDKVESETTKTREALDSVRKDDKDRKQAIQRLQREIDDAERTLGDRPDRPDLTDINNRLRENAEAQAPIAAQIATTNEFEAEVKREAQRLSKDERQIQQNLIRLSSAQGQRENECRHHASETWRAVEWYRKNKDRFHGQVFEPIRFQVQVTSNQRRFVDIAEGPIAMSSMNTFVFERRADYDLMMSEAADREKIRMNGSELPPGKTLADYKRPFPEDFKNWGFDCWAIDLIEGPDLVLAWLCHRENLQSIPVCLDPNRRLNTQEIEASRKIAKYYTPSGSNTVSVDQAAIDGLNRELAGVQDQKRMWAARGAENAELDQELHDRIDRLEREKAGLQDEKEALQVPLKRWIVNNTKLDNKRESLRRERAKPTAEAKAQQHRDKLAKFATKGAQLALEHQRLLRKSIDHQSALFAADLRLLQAESDLRAMNNSSNDQDVALNAKRAEVEEASIHTARLSEKAKALKVRITELELELPADIQAEAADERGGAERTLDEIQAEHAQVEANLGCTVDVSRVVLEQYDKRKREIEELREKVTEGKDLYDNCLVQVQDRLDKWLPRLDALVEQISDRFTAALEHLGIRGEVGLDKSDADYDKWGIQIKVAFRDHENIQVLNSHRQSGGERALTTVMYIMSLAELAKAPFALVDEINQGMDQRVERQVHNALVRTTCKDEVGQYFLITPKLLSDLDYHEKMKVLIINNGTWIPNKLSLQMIVDARLAKMGKGKGKAKVNGHAPAAVAAH